MILTTYCGKSVLVDDNTDLSLFSNYIEMNNGYPSAWIFALKKRQRLHRWIIGAVKGQIVDHINDDRLDNRRENLRIVTALQSTLNRKARGYFFLKGTKHANNPYLAKVGITENGVKKTVYLGVFATQEEAVAAYKSHYDSQPSEFKPRIISATA